MKIIFLRHGESEDDLKNEFGGWSDPSPTTKGIALAQSKAGELKELYPDIVLVLSSPLKRASLFAREMGKKLKLRVQENVYLKERNTYGLLNGLNSNYAKKVYPELYHKYENQEYIPGSERYDDFVERVGYLIKYLVSLKVKGTILCVTQGYLITTLIEEYLGYIREEIRYGSYIVCSVRNGELKLIGKSGITFLSKNLKIPQLKKFKIR